jgi:hypothetical protein
MLVSNDRWLSAGVGQPTFYTLLDSDTSQIRSLFAQHCEAYKKRKDAPRNALSGCP